MILPSDSEYQEAVQHPKQAFEDSELVKGIPELLSPALPIPKPRSGNFATVYKLQDKTKSWAVRCFTRTIFDDQKFRYETISKNPNVIKQPYFAGFKFLQKGIRIRSKWYPIVKMDWVQGVSLKSYIEKNLDNEENLVDLANKWLQMLKLLQSVDISHGDLQHENVLVSDKELRLIDYDGMYVPELRCHPSHENGHPNYQHPARNGLYFGPKLDLFSHLVITLSIVSLVYDPSLWTKFQGGDECLLFRKKDFLNPSSSNLIKTLLSFENEWVVYTTETLMKALQKLPEMCPFVNCLPKDFEVPPPTPLKKPATPSPGGDWLKDYL